FDNQHAYCDGPDELEDDFEDELQEEYEDEEEEEETEVSDPDADLQQKRARLDYKLKSTFESIFEKYGQDFEGVGDEIDLETGEVVVNNGHLLEMHDERDAGDASRRNPQREYTEEPEDTDDIPTSSLEEPEILDDEDDEEEEEILSEDEEMMEDDLILRGFARANRFVQASPELGPSRLVIPPRREPRPAAAARPAIRGSVLPSRTDILAQFGPQLGPQIVDFVSQQQVPNDSHIEPAWRAPELPSSAPVKRPTVKRATLAPEIERSPSPEASKSVWAPVRTRGPNKPKFPNADTIFRGQDMMPVYHHNQPPNHFRRQAKKARVMFTAEDDEILLDWVERVRERGLALWSERHWQELADKYPRHSMKSWQGRYQNSFRHLWSHQAEEIGSVTSDTSIGTHVLEEREAAKAWAGAVSYVPTRPPASERPSRIRKPAQRDSRIISWSEAVDTIQSLDPVLHAEMLED
ncbi:centromere protein Scm3-domain-containing protein, partial [Hyaloscypha finlandica]